MILQNNGNKALRVYHFIGHEHGLQSLRQKRLKIATLNELNDPFEFLGIASRDPEIRRALLTVKKSLAQFTGILCFSAGWTNPVLWSHYAEKHHGLCLGFDITAELIPVKYTSRRLKLNIAEWRNDRIATFDKMRKLLATKFSHWSYEKEHRMFISLEDREENDLYFYNFDNKLKLKQVIVGCESSISRADLNEALGDLANDVEVWKARLAFQTFRVVKQQLEKLWE